MKVGNYNFQYKSTGILQFDPGIDTKLFEPNWCLLLCDEEIANYYRWHLTASSIEIHAPNKLWSFHVSVIKREELLKNDKRWGELNGKPIEFNYGSYVSYSNGRHAWLNCYSESLCELRSFYGLQINDYKLKFHMTLGRLKYPTEPDVKRPGIIYNDDEEFMSL